MSDILHPWLTGLGRDRTHSSLADFRSGSKPEVSRRTRHVRSTPRADIVRRRAQVRFVPIVLKKSFLTDRRNFSGPPVRSPRRDVRDHIVSQKNDHGPPHRSYGALQQRKHGRSNFREIFGVLRFSTFATVSAISGLMHRSNLTAYSITSSAHPSSDRGIVRSSVLAVLRLVANSIFIGDSGSGSAYDLLVPIRTIVLGGNP